MRRPVAAALLALSLSVASLSVASLSGPAAARTKDRTPPTGTLIDNVRGVTLDEAGAVVRFTGLLLGEDGTIREVYAASDKRPARVAYKLDGKGRTLVPGIVDPHADVMALGLDLLARSGGGAQKAADGRPRPEDRDVAFAKAQDFLLARGITAVADAGTTIETWQTYRRAGDAGRLRVRIVAYAGGVADMALIGGPAPTPWLYQGRLKQNGVALTLNRAAGSSGASQTSDDRLRNLMSRAAIDNFQVMVSVDGAAAATAALDAVAELSETYKGERRWRIDGVASLAAADAARAAQLGVVATPPIDAAAGFGASTAVPREETFAALTLKAARALFAESRLGRIARGLRADFLFLSQDPIAAAPGQPRVLETWIEGQKVYDASAGTVTPPETAPLPSR